MSVLADRYASAAMRSIWSPESKIIQERNLWIAVMRAQSKLGHSISADVIADYEKLLPHVDLASIDSREKLTRHDVKARIEEFNALAGHEAIHAGMTSRDLTENVEAMQVRDGLLLIRERVIAVLAMLAERAGEYIDQPITGRSHNVAAQVTTLGKRFASAAEELLFAYERLENLLERYPIRGIKGPVGTAQDSVDLLGSAAAHDKLEVEIASHLGFNRILDSTGQIYPRSFDFGGRRQHIGLAHGLDNVRRMTATRALGVEGVDGAVFECSERGFHKARFVERIGMDRHLHIHFICHGKTIVDRRRRGAPIFVQL